MTLHQSGKGNVTNIVKKIRKVLEEHENSWNADQKNVKDYSKNLLQSSESSGGPCTKSEELQSVLLQNLIHKERLSKQG